MSRSASTGPVAWITGAGGLVGSHLTKAASRLAPDWTVIPLTRRDLDLADLDAVSRRFKSEKPALVLHCAGLTRNAACQTQPNLARQLNVTVTQQLCTLSESIPLLFLSTDLVFDGQKGHYSESDRVNPLSLYAETKVQAEQLVLQNPLHTVVRIAINAGISPSGDRSFTELTRLAQKRGETLCLFTDEFRSPIHVTVTARALWELIIKIRQPGLYHLGGSERLSRWQIGQLLARRHPELGSTIQPGSVLNFNGPARPKDTSLDCAKLQTLLSFPLPGLTRWEQEHPNEPM